MDAVWLVVIGGFFTISIGFVQLCEILRGEVQS